MLIPGCATPAGTARFESRFAARLPGHFRNANGLRLSSIGLGTYLGEPTASHDALYHHAIERAVEMGSNVIDSAINYRHQRSERAIGVALADLMRNGQLKRDEIFVATKGGFLTFDADEPADPAAYFQEHLIRTGLIRPEEVAAGCHVMSPKYLESQIEASRKNLGLETIDLYYVHNPETQLSEVSHDEFYRRLEAAFVALEKAAGEGKIRSYGTATWNAYRAGPESREAMSLQEVFRVAERAGGRHHHFRAIQLPFNLAMPEALLARTQPWQGERVPALQVARTQGLAVFASASLLQSQLARGIPPEIQKSLPGLASDAQRAIQFARSAPGITCALVGMSQIQHAEENLGTAQVAPLALDQFRRIFSQSG
ncbi:MAG TPA: aldo/keto reductase [Terriglobia bacterium]|nr:aldo/keto reductase [Terriglobia bacterium]